MDRQKGARLPTPHSLDLHFGELRCVVAEDVDDLDHNRITPRLRILMPVALRLERRLFPRPVGLPLVVESPVIEVEVDRPIVDEISPALDPVSHFRRNQILARDSEVLQSYSDLTSVALDVEID